MSGEDVIEIGTKASEILVGSFESGAFGFEALQEGVSAFASVVSSVDGSVSEVRYELIASEHCGSDFGAGLFGEIPGKGVAVVFVVVRYAHDGLTVCITNTLELRFWMSWCFGNNQCLRGCLVGMTSVVPNRIERRS